MGHALVAAATPGADPVHKVSIIPRGLGALGYTMQRPTEDRFLMTRSELEGKLSVLLGGRAAETLIFQHTSTGAADDLSRATDIARDMATRFAMVPALGPVTYEAAPAGFLGRSPCSAGSTASRRPGRLTSLSGRLSAKPLRGPRPRCALGGRHWTARLDFSSSARRWWTLT